jgi:hypothetical protein
MESEQGAEFGVWQHELDYVGNWAGDFGLLDLVHELVKGREPYLHDHHCPAVVENSHCLSEGVSRDDGEGALEECHEDR